MGLTRRGKGTKVMESAQRVEVHLARLRRVLDAIPRYIGVPVGVLRNAPAYWWPTKAMTPTRRGAVDFGVEESAPASPCEGRNAPEGVPNPT